MPEIFKTVGLTVTSIDIHKGAEDGTGFVYLEAVGADETPDIDGEIFDYATSKPYIEKWSEDFAERTKAAGQAVSYGNVRAQHGDKGAQNIAGTVYEPIDFRDPQKSIHLQVKVVDADAITKVREGAYTGMSIKGKLVGKKWKDGKHYRYTVDPIEWTVCDKPANPSATITVIKADGTSEVLKMAEKKLPGASLAYASQAIAKFKTISKASGWAGTGMSTIAQLGYILDSLFYLRDTTLFEAEIEGDESTIPARLSKVLTTAAQILEDMTSEEVKELIAMTETEKKAAEAAEVAKAAEIEKAAKGAFERAKAAHEEMGEHLAGKCKCAGMAKCAEKVAGLHEKMAKHFESEPEDAEKAAQAAAVAKAATVTVEKSATEKAVDALTEQVKTLTETVTKMATDKAAARPTPILAGTRVTKTDDNGGDDKDLYAQKSALDKKDPSYIDKAYAIDRAAEPELVKI